MLHQNYTLNLITCHCSFKYSGYIIISKYIGNNNIDDTGSMAKLRNLVCIAGYNVSLENAIGIHVFDAIQQLMHEGIILKRFGKD